MEPATACPTVHKTSSAVWDVPSPVAVNSTFTVKVGVLCSASCGLAARHVAIQDETGCIIGEGILSAAPWVGTRALYWRVVELTAPGTEGLVSRALTLILAVTNDPPSGNASSDETSHEPRHEPATVTFSFRTDRPPEHRVAVTVMRHDTGEPIEDVEVRLGLYTASTGSNGRAEMELPEGRVELTIRKDGFAAPPLTLEVTKSLSIDVRATSVPTRAEMDEKLLADYPWG
jgi:hypothetical protein